LKNGTKRPTHSSDGQQNRRTEDVMGFTNRIFLMLAIVGSMSLAGCGKQCPNSSLSGSGTSSGSSGGITTSNVCVSGSSTGGGGGGGSTTSVLLYYFALDTTGAGIIEAAGLSNTGTLALLSPFTPPTLPSIGTDNMVIANKQFLYVPMGNSTLQAFTINHTGGALTPIAGSPSASGADTAVSDPKGRFLFVGDEFAGQITVLQIDQTTGALTTTGTFQSFNMVSADSLAVDGSGKFLYVGQGALTPPIPIVAFSIDQNTGALTEIAGSPFNLGVATLHADSSGKFLLGVAGILDQSNSATDDHISVFSIDSAGTPTAVAGSPFSTTAAPFEFAINPSGQFVYTFGTDSTKALASLEGYQLNTSTGALTPLPGSPFTSLPTVQDCQFDQSGGAAFCIDAVGGTKFSVLNANPTTGALTHTVQDLTVTNNFPFAITD
jgi:6-phosphogluconolactonase (cycloisomerase 2 family)